MRINLVFAMIIIVMGFATSYSKDSLWQRQLYALRPLKATRDGVIATFRKKADYQSTFTETYKTKTGEFLVRYSPGLCAQSPFAVFDVPAFTVVESSFFPKKPFDPKDYGITFDGFSRIPSADVPKAAEYENPQIGISYFVTSRNRIESITAFVSEKDQHLRCQRE